MKLYITISVLLLFCSLDLVAQVPQRIVVEHFTNTLCSVCASRNPGFYTNFQSLNQDSVMHIAFHPSSPYKNCVFNKANVSENDGRTNYYNIYGSTPRLVIQGSVLSSGANYNDSKIISKYFGKKSPIQISISEVKYGSDSILSRVVVKNVSLSQATKFNLFIALSEDTISYSSPNGETVHYDVFRKSLSPVQGKSITINGTNGDSLVYSTTTSINSLWRASHIHTYVIVQDSSSKSVIQADKAQWDNQTKIITKIDEYNKAQFHFQKLWPNPVMEVLHFDEIVVGSLISIRNVSGQIVYTELALAPLTSINVAQLPSGIYLIEATSKNVSLRGKFAR